MFLLVKKNPLIYIQTNAMDSQHVAPVTSNLRINMNLIAELSRYRLKEDKIKLDLSSQQVVLPTDTQVIHLEMSYTQSTQKFYAGTDKEHTINERYFYKLIFMPGAEADFAHMRNIIERHTAQ